MINLVKKERGLYGVNLALKTLRGELLPYILALGGLSFGFLGIAAFLYAKLNSNVIPYIVTVDRQGVILDQGELKEALGIPEEIIAVSLCDFIEQLRTVTEDKKLQSQHIENIYAHLKANSQASAAVSAYFKQNNPLEHNKNVSIHMKNIIRVAPYTFQFDWTEDRYDNGQGPLRYKMRALVTYELIQIKHRTIDSLKQNPLGIFINELSVSERIKI